MTNNYLNIGFTYANYKTYILDANFNLLPVGAVGELYIGGVGLARGYLNQPQITQERFILNPFQSVEDKAQNRNTRIYKTGDLCRYVADGNLVYIGRNDFQVKIRGFRIELGEIESVLDRCKEIKQSVVIAKEHIGTGNKYLAAYYAADRKLNENEILMYLASRLPDYMLPSILIWMDKLPLTSNGKLDRNALPDVFLTNLVGQNYVAPRDELEAQVCGIFAEVLNFKKENVGISDDFFKLGGNSILAIKLCSVLKQQLKLNVPVSQLLFARTIENLLHDSTDTKFLLESENNEVNDKNYIMSTMELAILNHLLFIGLNYII